MERVREGREEIKGKMMQCRKEEDMTVEIQEKGEREKNVSKTVTYMVLQHSAVLREIN